MISSSKGSDALDRSVIQSLKSYAMKPDFLRQLISIFEEHAKTSIVELQSAQAAHDLDTIKRVAHRLKGSCLNIGAKQMVQDLLALEALPSMTDDGLESEPYVAKLADELELTCQALKSELLN